MKTTESQAEPEVTLRKKADDWSLRTSGWAFMFAIWAPRAVSV